MKEFIVKNINKELKNANSDYNLVQMQYFLESVFDNEKRKKALLKQITRK